MKIKDITKVGFYQSKDDTDTIYEIIENSDLEWLKEYPSHKLLVDEWNYDFTDDDGNKIYGTADHLSSIYYELADIEVSEITNRNFEIIGSLGATLIERKSQNDKRKNKNKQKRGRPWGSKSSNRTENFTKRISPDEKEYLEKCLTEYRSKNEKILPIKY